MTDSTSGREMALSWSRKWHILNPGPPTTAHQTRYRKAICGAYVPRETDPRYPERLRRVQDGAEASTGTCKTCLRISNSGLFGQRAAMVVLPEPTTRVPPTEDENGYWVWPGVVIVYDDGEIERNGIRVPTDEVPQLREMATAVLAAIETSERLRK